jgi:hypothetical protein
VWGAILARSGFPGIPEPTRTSALVIAYFPTARNAHCKMWAANFGDNLVNDQESTGAKFRGALADTADKVARRLGEETKKSRALVAVQQ